MSTSYTLDLCRYSESTIMQLLYDGIITKDEYANELVRRTNAVATGTRDNNSTKVCEMANNSEQLCNTTMSGSESSDDGI